MGRDLQAERDRVCKQIASGERGGSTADRAALLAFADELQVRRTDTGLHRQIKHLRHCRIMAEEAGGLADTLDSERAAKRLVGWIHDAYNPDNGTRGSSEETNKDYRVALKKFGRLLSGENGDDVPDSMDWISSGMPSSFSPAPDPSKMWDWEDVHDALDACRTSRDRALIALQMDAGMRSGELRNLRLDSFADGKYALQVHVAKGKEGQRSVNLIPSAPYVRAWRKDHPADPTADVPLWTTEDSSPGDCQQIAYHTFRDVFANVADRAGIAKPNDPTNLRKSNAAWLASEGSGQAFIEDRQGRERGSDHIARYIARFGPESERMYAELNGIEIDAADEPAETGPITCPRCERETPRDRPLCMWCSQALSPAAADAADDHDDAMFDSVVEADDPELVEDLQQVRGLLDKHGLLQGSAIDAGSEL